MTFQKVVIVGCGVLGSQIALQTAYCGFDVTVLLRSDDSIKRSKPKIDRLRDIYLDTMEKMKTDPTQYCRGFAKEKDFTDEEIDNLKAKVEEAYKDIKITTSFEEACKGADLIIESIVENLEEKAEMYKKLAQYMEEKTVIVTNSSTLLPSKLADFTGRPEKYLAFHFANRIWMYNTVEIMGHDRTDKKYFEEMAAFAEQINMIPLRINKEKNGYILNSMLVPYLESALTLWAENVSDPKTIDLTWKLATGAPHGPFQIVDIVGLTTCYNIQVINPNYKNQKSTHRKIADKLKPMIDAGKLGVNAGEGFYKYN